MRSDNFGQIVLNTEDVFNALYSGKINLFDLVNIESSKEIEKFNKAVKLNYDSFNQITPYQEESDSIKFFDEANQCDWFMPKEYLNFPIHQWLSDQCKTEEELARVDQELLLFVQHGMFDLLFYLKYLVDTMRSNQIVWGVGRGSSVASYVLYLLGIHKVDSIKYKLDIHEFLK
jgi:DNA polymerase III alpha subunit